MINNWWLFLADDNKFATLWEVQMQLTSIILTTILICTFSIIYNVKIRNHHVGEKMSGFLVLVEMFITKVEDLVVSIMGRRYRKLTPYAMYIILYIVVSSILSLLGFESVATSYTVAFSMGFVTFILIYYFGFRYQKLAYFKRYLNPIELFTQFTPLFSISFRLFGNILGGAIIMGLVYALGIGIEAGWAGGSVSRIWNSDGDWAANWDQQYIYFWTGFNIFTTLLAPWLHMYFDLFDGVIQSIVFTMLTLSYWAEAMGEEGEKETVKRHARRHGKALHHESDVELDLDRALKNEKRTVVV
ncbi:F-type H+-transporting ATPase subunit a [Entomoplasma freundtii]|uniref:F0F1 ATP synthase subunit A n=1 Tax=Entomoplasma freundtii TaxID=74700 RepID=A0A2K8NSE6_9MOLU|nr:F0F1 ATP synthase subunit A [Entomoplasma freundtii]ATZ16674.1 F0F1 ATP synthase subunit A [Entomoplasma freundtii]TDY58159.1 F-type H+-transporting ATPase subunit a [Entomoplasma freundtii]